MINRFAMFVDSDYVFSQGSAAVYGGTPLPREQCNLDAPRFLSQLLSFVNKHVELPGASHLLRTYWYDRPPVVLKTRLQHSVALAPNTTLRFIGRSPDKRKANSIADYLLMDLSDLASHGSISDALIVSDDANIALGHRLDAIKNRGVRIHVLVLPTYKNGLACSIRLAEAADCRVLLPRSLLERPLTLITDTDGSPSPHESVNDQEVVDQLIGTSVYEQIVNVFLRVTADSDRGLDSLVGILPDDPEFEHPHKQLLGIAHQVFGRFLSGDEIRELHSVYETMTSMLEVV